METATAANYREEPSFPLLTEQAYANYLVSKGANVKARGSVYWIQTRTGFWEPSHWMVRCDQSQLQPPTCLCWGFRCVTQHEVTIGRGHLPVHLLEDISGYDTNALDGKRRNQLRACRRRVKIVQLLHSTILEEQGFGIMCSAHRRTGYGHVTSLSAYLDGVKRLMSNYPGLVMAGLIDGKLGGWLYGKVIGKTAYIDSIIVATEALSSNIGTGLVFDFVQACRKTGVVTEVVYGLATPEDPRLTAYKESMLFPVVRVPTRVWILPLIAVALRLVKPHVFHRLTGRS